VCVQCAQTMARGTKSDDHTKTVRNMVAPKYNLNEAFERFQRKFLGSMPSKVSRLTLVTRWPCLSRYLGRHDVHKALLSRETSSCDQTGWPSP
jgi:hypothetical protein